MKHITLLPALLILAMTANAQQQKTPANQTTPVPVRQEAAGVQQQTSTNKVPDSICCCKDIDPCFKGNAFYETKPENSAKDILLDFKARALGIPKNLKIKKGDFIRVKVVNYNPLLYKVSIDNRDSSVTQPTDAGLLGMFLSPDKFTGAVAGLSSQIGTPPKSPKENKDMAWNTEDFHGLIGISMRDRSDKEPKLKQREIDSIIAVIKSDSAKAKELLDKHYAKVLANKGSITGLRKRIDSLLSVISKYYAQLQKMYLGCEELKEENLKVKADEYLDSLNKFSRESKALSAGIFTDAYTFKFELTKYVDLIKREFPELSLKHWFIDTFYKIAAAELTGLDTSITTKKNNDVYAAFIKLSQNTVCFTSLPIYIGNDIKLISIGLKPVDQNSNLPSYQTSFSIPNYQPRIWGVSGGIFITGLKNEIYSNRRNPNDTLFRLAAEKQSKVQIGVNALAYMAWQVTAKSPNYAGISFGAGMSLESKPKPRILLGASFITGEKNRIGFTAGIAGGYTSRLSDGFSTSTPYLTAAENYQRDILTTSWFFSINYSFLSK